MGVTGLWNVVHPCARPIKIETLNKKRLAVDASIWIYQFLKAVRDKEGHALRNSHVVGFFRRICKLLYLGIKPVFVFDGGAPVLKKQTINNRKRRREGRRDDAVKTAGKLLALQMHRAAEEEEQKRKSRESNNGAVEEGDVIGDDVVYAEEVNMTPQERQKNRKFKKQDAYHLPDLNASLAEMGQPNDPRIMSLEELQHYANQFQRGEDINVYDFSKIDFDSQFFTSLPASDRYNILNAARLRSRLRMGYSKEQLDQMFPDRMAFSRFQIDRVRERNELTQRLMHINNAEGELSFGVTGMNRVAGEKGREYVLVRNDGVEGGWALGVVSNEGKKEKPIDVDLIDKDSAEDEDSEDEMEFEDIPMEGINRLPRRPAPTDDVLRRDAGRRQAVYSARKKKAKKPKKVATVDSESLFVQSASEKDEDEDEEEEWEDVVGDIATAGDEDAATTEDEDLQKAIAMSLAQTQTLDVSDGNDEIHQVFPDQKKAEEVRPFPKSKISGRAIANMANARANLVAAAAAKPSPATQNDSDEDDDQMDLQAALVESRKSKYKATKPLIKPTAPLRANSPSKLAKTAGFDGPLPFEKLNLGASLLGKKKIEKIQQEQAGGFEIEVKKVESKEKEARPLPPWFAGNLDDDLAAQRKLEEEQREEDRRAAREAAARKDFVFDSAPKIQHQGKQEIIDLEAEAEESQTVELVTIDSPDELEEDDDDDAREQESLQHSLKLRIDAAEEAALTEKPSNDTVGDDDDDGDDMFAQAQLPKSPTSKLGDVAERIRAEPPRPNPAHEISLINDQRDEIKSKQDQARTSPMDEDEAFDWSDSDHEQFSKADHGTIADDAGQTGSAPKSIPSPIESDDEDFEDVLVDKDPSSVSVTVKHSPTEIVQSSALHESSKGRSPSESTLPAAVVATEDELQNITIDDQEDEYPLSDPEEEELLRQLAQETEEHARFTSTLNNRTVQQNIADYEKELKQLRTQQKNERRDADEVTQTMITECQQLLTLFGLPYITAPMEAEAQCAQLVQLGLVDGIVTDDSDVFLFGGTRVYKNVFNQAKFVECYLNSDLESEFGLTRTRLIAIAQLLGSDYTEGLPGIGPVTALEILSEFDTLTNFNAWWNDVQSGKIPKEVDAAVPFRKKFRRSHAQKLFLPVTFPNPMVEAAYLEPEVDSDPSEFVWGVPDLNSLRSFLMSTIGWSGDRVDEILVPVIRDMNRREQEGTQANITAFFDGTVGAGAFAPRRREAGTSKRLENALQKIGSRARGDAATADDADVHVPARDAATVAGRKTATVRKTNRTKRLLDVDESGDAESEEERAGPTKKKKKTRNVAKGKRA